MQAGIVEIVGLFLVIVGAAGVVGAASLVSTALAVVVCAALFILAGVLLVYVAQSLARKSSTAPRAGSMVP